MKYLLLILLGGSMLTGEAQSDELDFLNDVILYTGKDFYGFEALHNFKEIVVVTYDTLNYIIPRDLIQHIHLNYTYYDSATGERQRCALNSMRELDALRPRREFDDSDKLKIGGTFRMYSQKKDGPSPDDLVVAHDTSNATLQLHLIYTKQYLRRAGDWGIAAVTLMVVSAAITAAGAVRGSAAATYTGVGIGGSGFLCLLPCFAHLHTAGKRWSKVAAPQSSP